MSATATVESPKAIDLEAMRRNLSEQMEAQSDLTDEQRSVMRQHVEQVPLSDADEAAIQAEVSTHMDKLRGIDIFAGDNVEEKMEAIFDRSQERARQAGELRNAFLDRSLKRNDDNLDAIQKMRAALAVHNPENFDLSTAERLLSYVPFLPSAAKRQIEKMATVMKNSEAHIEEIVEGVSRAKDDGVRAKSELAEVQRKSLLLAKESRREYRLLEALDEKIDEFADEIAERDPAMARSLRSGLLFRLRMEMVDVAATVGHALLGNQEALALTRTQDQINKMADRLMTNGRLQLTLAQTLSVAANEQRSTAEMLAQITAQLDGMTASTAEKIADHTRDMQKMSEQSLTSPESLKKAFDGMFSAIDEIADKQAKQADRARTMADGLKGVTDQAVERIGREKRASAMMGHLAAGVEKTLDNIPDSTSSPAPTRKPAA